MVELQDIVGQDAAIGRLQKAWQADRLPHAILLTGPEGVGRRTTATAFAKVLLCEKTCCRSDVGLSASASRTVPLETSYVQACGTCDDCRMMVADAHPDFQIVYKELARYHDNASVRARVMQDLGIDVIRRFLIEPSYRSPVRGRGKVFIVREAELMSIAAQNALLKTLEEPPVGVTILLITTRPEQLLPTTLSRCWQIRFGRLPEEFVAERLIQNDVKPPEAQFWAGYTNGSLGRAIRRAKQGLYEIKRDMVTRLAGLGPSGDADLAEHFVKTTETLAHDAIVAAKKADGVELSKLLASRRAAGVMLTLIASVYRDVVTVAAGVDRPLVHADQTQAVKKIAGRFEPIELAEILQSLGRYEQLLWRNVNPKCVWDNVVITCASAERLGV